MNFLEFRNKRTEIHESRHTGSSQTNYEGESNENLKSAVKIRNTARLSCKLTTVILMV